MNTKHFLTAGLCGLVLTLCQAQQVEWIKGHEGRFTSHCNLFADGLGGLYGSGSYVQTLQLGDSLFSSGFEDNIYVVKWDSLGEVIWAVDLGEPCPSLGGDRDRVYEIGYDPLADEIVIAGTYTATFIAGPDTLGGNCVGQYPDTYMHVIRLDADGHVLWGRRATGSQVGPTELSIDMASQIHVIGNAPYGVILEGQPDVTLGNGSFYAVYNDQGDLLSAEQITANGFVTGAELPPGLNAYLSGSFNSTGSLLGQSFTVPQGLTYGYIAQGDLHGSATWIYEMKSSEQVAMLDCIRVGADKVVAIGYSATDLILPTDTIETVPGVSTPFLICLDTLGTFQWLTMLDSEDPVNVGWDLRVDDADQVYVFGRFMDQLDIGGVVLNASASTQGFIARFDTLGVCRSAWDFGKVLFGQGSILPTSDGIYVSCVYDSVLTFNEYTFPHSAFQSNLMVAKLDSLSGFTGIQTLRSMEYGALHIYANPNSGVCTIDLPQELRFTPGLVLSIYDGQGRRVQQVPVSKGSSGIRMDISAEARGMYHVELTDGQQRYSGTIVFE